MPEVQSIQDGSRFNDRFLFAHSKLQVNHGCELQ
jgi:hypothetical protein